MSGEPKKSLAKIRTFAHDVEAERKKGGLENSVTPTVPEVTKTAPVQEKLMVVAEPVQVKEVTAHIPAFHELHKKPETIHRKDTPAPIATSFVVPQTKAVPIAARPSVTPTPEKIIRVQPKKTAEKITRDGVIITDNKNNKLKFFPTLLASFDTWIEHLSDSFKKKAPPTYTITDTQRRKGVIQKATSKTGSIFTADNETLKEQIRRRQAQAKLEDPAEIFWSPQTETGYALLTAQAVPAPKPANVQLEFKKRTAPPITVIEPTPVIPLPEPPRDFEEWVTEVTLPPISELEPTSGFEDLAIEVPVVYPKTFSVGREIVPPPPIVETPAPEILSERIEEVEPEMGRSYQEERLNRARWFDTIPGIQKLRELNTNALAISIVGFMSGVFLTIYIVSGVVQILAPDTSLTTAPITAAPILAGSTVTTLTLPSLTRVELEQALSRFTPTGPGTSEISLLTIDGGQISTPTIFSVVAFNVNPNFNQSVSKIRFGFASNEPIILLAVTNDTTVLGALLEWEPLMARDIASLLQHPLQATSSRFVDRTIGGTDVRVLEANGSEVLVYGFLSENIVAITHSTSAFQTLLSTQQ